MTAEKELKEFYWEAMAKRWSLGTRKKAKKTVPNHEIFVFSKGNLLLVELHGESVNGSGLSGTINIFDQEILVWTLHYHGFCDKLAKSFLREVLAESFRNGNASGIRGPKRVEGKKFVYRSTLRNGNHFSEISGREQIIKVQIHRPLDKILAEISFHGGLVGEDPSFV